ncbi:hypothetical protein ABZ686_24535, partial [Streptomyces sp. NPDC006992]
MPTPSPTSPTSHPSPPSPPPPPSTPPFAPARHADGDSGSTGGSGSGSGSGDNGGRATCQCDNCPHGARQSYRKALAAFVQRRDELAVGLGVPVGLAHSAGASRQWVSDELTGAARALADRSREEGEAWVARLWRRTVGTVWVAAG